MRRLISGLTLALLLAACGGDDDDASVPSTRTATPTVGAATATLVGPAPTTAPAPTPTPAGAATATPANSAPSPAGATPTTAPAATATTGGSAVEGGPTPEDPSFPDVVGTLAIGSSVEADTGDDMAQTPGRVRVTIDNIRDGVEPGSSFYVVQPGNRLWAVDVTIASVGEGGIPLAEWQLQAGGVGYEPVFGVELGDDILYFELASGDSVQGVITFEIPTDATIDWLLVDPSIYVGTNIVFVP